MMSHHLWSILSSIGEEEHLKDRFNNLVYVSHHIWPILSSIGEEEHLRDRFNNLVYDVTSHMAHFIFHR